MRIFFCDESGSACKIISPKSGGGKESSERSFDALLRNPARDPWYVLCGLCISDVERPVLTRRFWEIKKKWLSRKGLKHIYIHSPEAELHAAELFAVLERSKETELNLRYPVWEQFRKEEIAELLRECLQLLVPGKHFLYAVAIDQRALYRRFFRITWYPAYLALTFLWNLAARLCEYEGEQGLIVVDRGGGLGREYEVDDFLATRDQVRRVFTVPEKGFMSFDDFIIEEPIAVDSRRVQLIQLADLVTYIIGRAIKRRDPSWEWFQKVKPLFALHGRKKIPAGAGLTFLPDEAIPLEFLSVLGHTL